MAHAPAGTLVRDWRVLAGLAGSVDLVITGTGGRTIRLGPGDRCSRGAVGRGCVGGTRSPTGRLGRTRCADVGRSGPPGRRSTSQGVLRGPGAIRAGRPSPGDPSSRRAGVGREALGASGLARRARGQPFGGQQHGAQGHPGVPVVGQPDVPLGLGQQRLALTGLPGGVGRGG